MQNFRRKVLHERTALTLTPAHHLRAVPRLRRLERSRRLATGSIRLGRPPFEQTKLLASSPSLCRLENRANRAAVWALHRIRVDQLIASFRTLHAELNLDFDANDDRVWPRR